MKYGFFDSEKREYVITRPDTPSPWANYLGSPEYGAIISNNAGGYSFQKSGANGRIIRYRFNGVASDTPGRYVYLKDLETGEYWSNSWAPVCKDLDKFESRCQHGMGYTRISSKYEKIACEATYFVPMNERFEVWACKVKNTSDKTRKIALTGVCEFVNDNNYEQDQVNLQYTLFITKTYYRNNYILQKQNEPEKDSSLDRFLVMAKGDVTSYCGDRDKFTGAYRGYHNPVGIESGLQGDLNYCGNSVGALCSELTLEAGEEKEIIFVLGQRPEAEIQGIVNKINSFEKVEAELNKLKEYWEGHLSNLRVETPDEDFNNMVNTWNAYNCFMTFIWSRAASFSYCGLRNGYGYRDTVQDIQGIIHLAPELAKNQIEFMLTAQVTNGAGLPLVKYTHKPGCENTPDDPEYVKETGHPSYRADDALWLFPTVYKYIAETGDEAFLDKNISYANDGASDSVYNHLKQAIEFSMNNLGAHGMPAGLHADWNDCLRLGKKGESTFVAFQLVFAIRIMEGFAAYKSDTEYLEYLKQVFARIDEPLSKCFDEDRFIRGYTEDGMIIGERKSPEASMWLNPQSWAVISGYATDEQAKKCLDSVDRELNTAYGAMVMYPPYVDHAFEGALMHCYNECVKENAGIFSQPQGWLILASAKLGDGDRAYKYWKEASPATYNENAEHRCLEPYVYGQFVEGADSPYAGRAHVHWLTGTASTVMVGTTEGILGLKPEIRGIVIDPSIPSAWDSFKMTKNFRNKLLNITVNNTAKVCHGVKSVIVNGTEINGLLIEENILKEENNIEVIMG